MVLGIVCQRLPRRNGQQESWHSIVIVSSHHPWICVCHQCRLCGEKKRQKILYQCCPWFSTSSAFLNSTPLLIHLSTAPPGESWIQLQYQGYWYYQAPQKSLLRCISPTTWTEELHWHIWQRKGVPGFLEWTPKHVIGPGAICWRSDDRLPQEINLWDQLFCGKVRIKQEPHELEWIQPQRQSSREAVPAYAQPRGMVHLWILSEWTMSNRAKFNFLSSTEFNYFRNYSEDARYKVAWPKGTKKCIKPETQISHFQKYCKSGKPLKLPTSIYQLNPTKQ